MKKALRLLVLLYGLFAGLQAQTVTIGNGSVTDMSLPMYAYFGYSYTQSIYYQSEITAGMTISKISYQYTGAGWTDSDNKIFMGHTDKTTFTSAADWVPLANMTEVFSGVVSVENGLVIITLTTPFVYNGIDNLVIAFDANTVGYHNMDDRFYCTESNGLNRSISHFSDGTNANPATPPSGTLIAGYANIQLISPPLTPEFNITPSSNNYGLLLTNATKLQNFLVKNSGLGFLEISNADITITGTDATSFVLGSIVSPIHLATNESVTIPVSFVPTTAGDKSATLRIVDNITRAVRDIALSGSSYNASAIPFSEDFEGSVFPAIYWQRLNGFLSANSIVVPEISGWEVTSFANDSANGKGAKINNYGSNRSYWLVTPPIDLGIANTNLVLMFDVALTKWNTNTDPALTGIDDKFSIVISPDNGTTWSTANILRQYDNAVGSTHIYNSLTPIKTSVNLALTGYSGLVKIGFYAESTVSNADNDLHLDNIKIEDGGSAIYENNLPLVTALAQNYPNPFNPTTVINYNNNIAGNVKLTVINAKGETIATLINSNVVAGNHIVNFDGTRFNSGLYFYRLETSTATITKKMLLVK